MGDKNKIIYYISIFVIIYVICRLGIYIHEKYIHEKYYDYIDDNYISSKNFLFACDHHTNDYMVKKLPSTYPKSNGETIYIHTNILPKFIKEYLPNIKYNFVLVTGDCIETIPDSYKKETEILLNNPQLIKWFAQNSKISNDKIIQLPLGLDFHTSTIKAFWGPIQTVREQIDDIYNIKSIKVNKKNKCYVNFETKKINVKNGYFSDRIEAINKISKGLISVETKRLQRIDTWKNMINYKYVISPHGAGLDCHRTWEAIVFDCIPIVKRSKLSSIYDGLPVLIVDNWSDLNQKLLDDFKPNYSNIDKIYMKYWINLFNQYKTN